MPEGVRFWASCRAISYSWHGLQQELLLRRPSRRARFLHAIEGGPSVQGSVRLASGDFPSCLPYQRCRLLSRPQRTMIRRPVWLCRAPREGNQSCPKRGQHNIVGAFPIQTVSNCFNHIIWWAFGLCSSLMASAEIELRRVVAERSVHEQLPPFWQGLLT